MYANRMQKDDILSQIKIAVMAFPMKAMADNVDKAYSTLSNEIDHRDTAKLGFLTVLSILHYATHPAAPPQSRWAALKALDLIEEGVNRIAFPIPKAQGSAKELISYVSQLTKKFGESVSQMAEAVDPNSPGGHTLTVEESNNCLKKLNNLLRAGLELRAYLQNNHQ